MTGIIWYQPSWVQHILLIKFKKQAISIYFLTYTVHSEKWEETVLTHCSFAVEQQIY